MRAEGQTYEQFQQFKSEDVRDAKSQVTTTPSSAATRDFIRRREIENLHLDPPFLEHWELSAEPVSAREEFLGS
jgi:hypothetical protein